MTQEQVAFSGSTRLGSRRATTWVLLALVAATLVVYYPILVTMVSQWRTDPDYSHGFFVVPLALMFAYEKRHELESAPIEGSWWGVLLLAFGLAVLSVGQLGSLLTPLRAGFVFTLMGLVLLMLGWPVFRLLLFPLSFMLLMVPLPESLLNVIAFPLQLLAAEWAVWLLQAFALPVNLEGNIIHLPSGDLFVADACSGLRSLMALLTLGIVFAHFFRRGRILQQLVLVASTIPIAILVNAIRVALTAFLAHRYGHEAAGGFIHEFQGLITFSVAFLMLLLEARILGHFLGTAPSGSASRTPGRAGGTN